MADSPLTKHVLLVEDNPGDVRLIREALREADCEVELSVVTDGQQALAFLRHEEPYANVPRPSLVLLDLNLPGLGGHDILAAIKGDVGLRSIPVIVMTSSRSPQDIHRAYDAHANCYVTKASDFESCVHLMRGIDHFWLSTARIP